MTASNSGGPLSAAFDDVSVIGSSSMTYDVTHAIGTLAVKHVVAPKANAYYAWNVDVPSTGTLFGSVAVWFDRLPDGSTRVVRASSGGAIRFAIDVLATGRLRLADGAGKVLVSQAPLTLGRWATIAWRANFADGTIEVRLYDDRNGPPVSTMTSPLGRFTGQQVDQVQFGRSGHQQVAASFWTDSPTLSQVGFTGLANRRHR